MVTPDQLAKVKKICEKLTSQAPGLEEAAEAAVKMEGEELDHQDPFGDAIPEEIEVPSESEEESDEEVAEPTQNRAREQSTAAGSRLQPSKARKTKPKAKLGRSKAMDVDVARFIATDSCRTRILDEIF
ncbi:hypothetical protein FRC12_021895 [Ceratobasidium sp. 428]|nr:hypothetical protein FRC12_021895 [Ceratobasidium sp. 428]